MDFETPFKILESEGYIDYGKTVPIQKIEELLDIAKVKNNGRPFDYLDPYLGFKLFLEEKGFFCNSKGLGDGSLRLLPIEDFDYEAEKIIKRTQRIQARAKKVMENARLDSLNEKQKNKHLHATNKLVLSLSAMKNVLTKI